MEPPESPNFDPEWSREQAQAAGSDGPFSPFERWQAWMMLEAHYTGHEGGDPASLLRAIRLCAIHRLPMPGWVADGYVSAFTAWNTLTANTLDDAFGVTRQKGKHLNAARKARKLETAVPIMVIRMRKKGRPIDEGMFAEIGAELNISASAASKAYYSSHYFRRLQKKR